MTRSTASRRQFTILLRFAIVLLAVLLGHDAIMAANPHTTVYHTAGHQHEVVVEECGPADGVVHAITLLPSFDTPVLPATWPVSSDAIAEAVQRTMAPYMDASTVRALLQVYLN